MQTEKKGGEFIRWFRAAAPYIHRHTLQTFVLHVDGVLLDRSGLARLVEDIALLNSLQIRQIIVFGVRPQAEALLSERGLESRYVRDLRVTDTQALECISEAVNRLRLEFEALLSMSLPDTSMAGARLRVSGGNFVMARPAGVIEGIDCQYTGKVRRIDLEAICTRLAEGCIVLVPPLGYSLSGEIFNLSAAETATHIASGIGANKLLFLTRGTLNDREGKPIRELSTAQAREQLQQAKEPLDTPLQRLRLGIQACEQGVERVHIIDQSVEGALLLELFSRDGSATLLSVEDFEHVHKARIEEISGILQLIEPLQREGALAPRSRADLEQQLECFTVAVRDGMVIACGALSIYADQQSAGIECLVVHPEYHGRNQGERLCRYLEREARHAKARHLYALTTQATHWFLERGFVEIALQELPIEYREKYNPARNSKALYRDLEAAQ